MSSLFSPGTTTGITFSSPDGYYDSNTNTLIIPKNLKSRTIQLHATNAEGGVQQIPISVNGLDESFVMETPQTFDDQTYPTASTKLSDGKMFFSTVVVDSAGSWEWPVIFRSTDNGTNWSVVDNYHPYDNGEAHALSMVSQGSHVFYCGYQWNFDDNGGADVRWFIRHSADAGNTWETKDLDTTTPTDSACQSMSVSPTTGYLYAGGFDSLGAGGMSRWIIKESQDQGSTWTIIYSQDVNLNGASVLLMTVAPDNSIWIIGKNTSAQAILYKGTFAGTWNFANMSVNFGSVNSNNYQTFGELTFVDSNTAYLNSRFGGRWTIKKTTDGGLNWTQVFDAGSTRTEAGEIEILANGDVVAMGTYKPPGFGPWDLKLARSTDSGATWLSSTLKTEEYANGALLIQDNLGRVHSINSAKDNASHLSSNDNGATWSENPFIVYTEKFYNEIEKLLILPTGTYLTIANLAYYSPIYKTRPGFAATSTDNGQSWNFSDLVTDPGNNISAYDAAYDQLGNIYTLTTGDTDLSARVRKSTDDGQNWTAVENYIHPTYPSLPVSWQSKGRLVVDQNNIPYYGAFYYNTSTNKGHLEIRKGNIGGTIWSTVKTFPLNGAYKDFHLTDLLVSPSNELWLSGKETNASNQPERVLYKSVDGGVNWIEVLREPNSVNDPFNEITFDSTGGIYLRQYTKVIKSTDAGATWTTLFNLENVEDLIVTSTDHIFVLTNNNKLYKLQSDLSWLLINDQVIEVSTQNRNYIYTENSTAVKFVELDSNTLGMQMRFTEAKVGTVDLMKRIAITD